MTKPSSLIKRRFNKNRRRAAKALRQHFEETRNQQVTERCKANPCCGDHYNCEVPRPQHRSGLYGDYERALEAAKEKPMSKGFRLDPSTQAFAVIILDCVFTLNQRDLTRQQYLVEWQKMVRKRMNQDISIEQLEALIAQMGEAK